MAPHKANQDETRAMPDQVNHENREGTGQLAGSPGAFVFSSKIGPRIPLAPPDEGGSGASGGGAEGGAKEGEGTGGEGGQGGDGGEGGEGTAQPPARPDYLPENLWDPEKGFKADDFNAILARDAERSAELAQVPPSADKYELKLPSDFKFPEGVEVKEGESVIDESDPRVAAARDFALSNRMNQSQFESLVAMGVQLDFAEQGRLKEALGEQVEALGPKGKERVGAVRQWVGAKLPAAQAEALTSMMYTKTQIEAFEALMRMNRGVPGIPGAGRDAGKTEISDEEYNKMSSTEKINYARQHSKT